MQYPEGGVSEEAEVQGRLPDPLLVQAVAVLSDSSMGGWRQTALALAIAQKGTCSARQLPYHAHTVHARRVTLKPNVYGPSANNAKSEALMLDKPFIQVEYERVVDQGSADAV